MSFNNNSSQPHPTTKPRLLVIGARVIPLIFVAGALQMVVTNYFFPVSEQQKAELNERRQAQALADSRTSKKPSGSANEELLSRDDSSLLSADNIQDIDLSHLDQTESSDGKDKSY